MLTSHPEKDMHRFKAVAVIGLSVAAAIVVMEHLPTQSNIHMVFMNVLFPGIFVFTLFVLSSDASLSNGITALALLWAVNTTFYYLFWRIALIAKRKFRPRKQPPA
jgi:uncharacterized membrane protein